LQKDLSLSEEKYSALNEAVNNAIIDILPTPEEFKNVSIKSIT
jgi:hypothetical protein